jgi:hypothetical protein
MDLQDYYSRFDKAGVRVVNNSEGTEKLLAIGTSTNGPVYLSREEAKKLKQMVDEFLGV